MHESDLRFRILATNPPSRAGPVWGPLAGLDILSLPVCTKESVEAEKEKYMWYYTGKGPTIVMPA
jgi:hypothetical protein